MNAFKRPAVALASAGLGVTALLATAAPAHADTGPVDHGHVDIAAINSSNVIGSIFDEFGGFDAWPLAGALDEVVINQTSGNEITCSNGVYTVPENDLLEDEIPLIGFENDSGSTYNIRLDVLSGPDSDANVTFDGEDAGYLSADVGDYDDGYYLPDETHEHGEWVFDNGTGTCSSAAQVFEVELSLEEYVFPSPNSDSQEFTITIDI